MLKETDIAAGGYRFADLLRERIVSSRSDLSDKQRRYGFPRPIKLGKRAAWYPKAEVHRWIADRAATRDQAATETAARARRRPP